MVQRDNSIPLYLRHIYYKHLKEKHVHWSFRLFDIYGLTVRPNEGRVPFLVQEPLAEQVFAVGACDISGLTTTADDIDMSLPSE